MPKVLEKGGKRQVKLAHYPTRTDYQHSLAPLGLDYREHKREHKKGEKMATKENARLSIAETKRIDEIANDSVKGMIESGKLSGSDFLACMSALTAAKESALAQVLSERAANVDRDTVRVFVRDTLASYPMPATKRFFKVLTGLYSRLLGYVVREQDKALKDLETAIIAKFGKDAWAIVKIESRAVIGTPENGNKTMFDMLTVSIPERKAIVHDANFVKARGYRLDKNFDVSKLSEKMGKVFRAICAIELPEDGLVHNAQMRAALAVATGKAKDDSTNVDLSDYPFLTKVLSKEEANDKAKEIANKLQ